MSVVGDFSVDTESFPLGAALRDEGTRIELDRIVTTDEGVRSFLWVRTDDPGSVGRPAEGRPALAGLTVLRRTDGGALCEARWSEPRGLVRSLVESDLAVLSATGDEAEWTFSVRADGWEAVAAFRQRCEREGVRVRIDGLSPLVDADSPARGTLTEIQRETLVEATRRGYYDTPRETDLQELADHFDITPRAVSKRLRRATANLVEKTLDPED